MELPKNREFAEESVFGKPPTSLKITTETGQELDWSSVDIFLLIASRDKNTTTPRYILFTTQDSYLKIEFVKTDAPPVYNSYFFDIKVIFKKDTSSPEQIVEEHKNVDLFKKIRADPMYYSEHKYIRIIKDIAQQNDIKLRLRYPNTINIGQFSPYSPRITKEYIPKSSTNVRFSIKTVINPVTNKTEIIPVLLLPKGTYLYRGQTPTGVERSLREKPTYVHPACLTIHHYLNESFIYFTLDPDLAMGYAAHIGCVHIHETTQDVALVDFWNKITLEEFININNLDNTKQIKLGQQAFFAENITGTQQSLVKKFLGIDRQSQTNFLNDETSKSKYKSIFKNGVFQKDSSGVNTGFLYKGLTWGPNEGQYKRHSIQDVDFYVIAEFLKQFPKDIDGIYFDIVPSDFHRSKGIFAFHSEIIIPNNILQTKFKLTGRKQLGNYVGSRRKTYRKKKNQKKTRKQTTRYL